MSNVSCPRCGESFRLPAADIPPGASARCPWCSETLPVAQLLSALPPVAELISAHSEPLANPFAASPESDADWEESESIESDSTRAFDFDAPAEDAYDQPFAPLDASADDAAVDDEQPYDFSQTSPLEFGEPAEPRPLSEVADVSFDQDHQRLNTRARPKKKPATIRSILGIVVGGLMAFPLAAVILALLGKPLDLGFWPFDGQTIATGTSSRSAAPLPATDESQASPRRPVPPQDRSLAYDLQRSANGNGVIQADHNSVESPIAAASTPADEGVDDDTLLVDAEPPSLSAIPLQVPGGRSAGPEWVEPLAVDEDAEPTEQPVTAEPQQPASEPTLPETAPLQPATPELAMPELGQPELETPELQLPTSNDILALPQPDDPPSIDAALIADEEVAVTEPADADAAVDAEQLPKEGESAMAEVELPLTADQATADQATADQATADQATADQATDDQATDDSVAEIPLSADEPTAAPATIAPAPLTNEDASEPLLTQPTASSAAVQAAVEQADKSLIAVQDYDQADGPAGLKRHLATLYQDIAAVGEKAQLQDEAVIGGLIARLKTDELIKVLAPAAPNWLKYSKRPNDGMLAVGVLRQEQDKWFVDWSGAVPLEVLPGDATLPAAGAQVLVLGRIVDAELASPAVELIYIEPL